MSAEHPHTSKFGLILTLVAIGGSAVAVLAWQWYSNRQAGLDTSGFDMSATIDTRPLRAQAPSAPAAAAEPTSLGMVKHDAGMSVMSPGASTPTKPQENNPAPTASGAKPDANANLKDAWVKNQGAVTAYIMKMQAKHPSILQYGKDWMACPDLRALRDQYHKDHDAMKFAYGVAKSENFSKLVGKYATDPGIRAVLIGGVKEAPPGLMSATAGAAANDGVVKQLLETVVKSVGLPKSLLPMIGGDADTKPPDTNQLMSDIMNSPEVQQKMQKGAVSLDQKDIDKAKEQVPNNGFTPLGGR